MSACHGKIQRQVMHLTIIRTLSLLLLIIFIYATWEGTDFKGFFYSIEN